MTDNGGERTAPRIIRTHDLVSGEDLVIVFFPLTDVLTINGHSVARSQKIEDLDGKAVFHWPLGDKTFTIETEILGELYL